jgi:hypothetical protein
MPVFLRGSCRNRHHHSGECMTWYYEFMIRRTRYRGSIPEARSKGEAEAVEVQKKREVYDGRYGKPTGDGSIETFVNETFLPWSKLNKRSWYDDQLITNMLCEHFRGKTFNQITPKLVERFKATRIKEPTKYGRERQPTTVNRELAVLSKIFTLAVREGMAANNPCGDVERLYVSNNRIRYLSAEEEDRLLAVLTGSASTCGRWSSWTFTQDCVGENC